jgi:hypothetical protein
MDDHLLSTLLPAAGIAAFERDAEGAFTAVVPLPAWFSSLAGDGTFPFLGHVLEEASAFWSGATSGSREWGPCAGIDESGREFHFTVTAAADGQTQYLLFRLDPGSDKVRDVLQQVRQRTLDAERHARREAVDARSLSTEVHVLLGRLLASGPTPAQVEVLTQLAARCDELVQRLVGRAPASE